MGRPRFAPSFEERANFPFSIVAKPGHQPEKIDDSAARKKKKFDGSKLRILLVEDNEINRDLALAFLAATGIHPKVAVNGKEACEAISGPEHFDIILMDCQMPVMDGYEATTTIRAMDLAKQPIIVAMTANVMKGESDRCLAVGMNDYLSKPVSRKKIIQILEKWSKATTECLLAEASPSITS